MASETSATFETAAEQPDSDVAAKATADKALRIHPLPTADDRS